MKVAIDILLLFIQFYVVLLPVKIIIDIVSVILRGWNPTGLTLVVVNIVCKATDPPLRFTDKYILPLRLGPVTFGMVPPIAILGLGVFGKLLQQFV